MYLSFLLRYSRLTGFLLLFMVVGCKQSVPEGSETQGGGLSVGRMEFRDPRALQAQQTRNTGLSAGPAAVKGQAASTPHNYTNLSTNTSSAQGSTSASDYAQSLNQYAKAMSSGRVLPPPNPRIGDDILPWQPNPKGLYSALGIVVEGKDVHKRATLERWNGMDLAAVQLEVNGARAMLRDANSSPDPLDRLPIAYEVRAKQMTQLLDWVKAYNESHPNQSPVVY